MAAGCPATPLRPPIRPGELSAYLNGYHGISPGWDEERGRRVIEHYESKTDDEAAAEDRAALRANRRSVMVVPAELVPVVRELIGQYQARART